MQRFGTSTVPTHVTGLQILQRKWGEALDGILTLREGEHPDCVRARLAWLEDKDLDKALEIMPRRCVAERSIWEFWRRSESCPWFPLPLFLSLSLSFPFRFC
jgi:tRNA pseudouridine13 synthase